MLYKVPRITAGTQIQLTSLLLLSLLLLALLLSTFVKVRCAFGETDREGAT